MARIEALEGQLEEHEKDLRDAAGELLVPFPEPDTLTAKLVRANRILRAERHKAEQRVARLEEALTKIAMGNDPWEREEMIDCAVQALAKEA